MCEVLFSCSLVIFFIFIVSVGPMNQAYHNVGSLNLAAASILQAQQQAVFSPPTTGITHSPVQILGVF